MSNQSTSYLGNPNLKRVGVKIHFTQEQTDIMNRCAADPDYFIQNYVKIIHVDRGLIPFVMWPYQQKMVRYFRDERFVICKMPRQSGKSTTVVSFMLWKILFLDRQSIAILANKGQLARDMLEKIKLAYEHLPLWMQQGVKEWNKGSITLENDSRIIASATSSSAVRGGTYNLIFLDEFAFVQRNIADYFFTSVYPTISSGESTQMIIVSTPFGMNHFYKMWMDSIEGRSLYMHIDVHWSETPGRDAAWRENVIRNTSETQFRQEFETEFIGSSNTLIDPLKLRQLAFITPKKDKFGVDLYVPPQPSRIYVITVDTAQGVERDRSAFSVIDVTTTPYMQVAKYKSDTISITMYPEIIARIAIQYNNAFILVETNDVGQQIANQLHQDLEYENVLATTLAGRGGQRIGGGFGKASLGVKMTKQVKRLGCLNLKELIEADKLITQDFDTIEELSTFVSVKQSYEAEEGSHDDVVMTLVTFAWLVKQPYFKDLTNIDIRRKLLEEQNLFLEEDLLPVGYVDDGKGLEHISLDKGARVNPNDPFSWPTSRPEPQDDFNERDYY